MQKSLNLLIKILLNKRKNDFEIRLGTALMLSSLGIVGLPATILTPLFAGFLGVMKDLAIFNINLTLDAYKEGQKLDEFRDIAKEIYDKTTAKIYDEEQKRKIRQDYLDIISRVGRPGP